MRLRIKNDNGIERMYVEKSVRISPKKVVTQNVEKLGRLDHLMKSMNLSRDEVIEWAQKHVDELNDEGRSVTLSLSAIKAINPNEQRTFKAGYLFLQNIYAFCGLCRTKLRY